MVQIDLKINGQPVCHKVPDNTLLVTFIRETLGLTGTHVGCDTSQCGACTIHVNGETIKACTMFAASANGTEITTIEGLAVDGKLHPMQQAFHENHGLQCGFCTPGMIMQAVDLARQSSDLDADKIRQGIEGNLCRCTGYQNIVEAVAKGASMMAGTNTLAHEA